VVQLRSFRFDLGYDGEAFFGSQRQSGVRTVQSEVEDAIRQVTGQRSRLAFAGRTDRGVHAVGQVATGTVQWSGDLEHLRYAIDSVTGADLRVYRVVEVDPEFHARFSARRREYRYRVFAGDLAPVLLRKLVWSVRTSVDLDLMNRAGGLLAGETDFKSFAGAGKGTEEANVETIRQLDVASWRRISETFEPGGDVYEFRIVANGFLPHMVRNIVGAMVSVGTGNRTVDWFESLIEARDRTLAPPPAPPCGLILWAVEYDEHDA
jgi:tRNA pseudouridine38-40 synthase